MWGHLRVKAWEAKFLWSTPSNSVRIWSFWHSLSVHCWRPAGSISQGMEALESLCHTEDLPSLHLWESVDLSPIPVVCAGFTEVPAVKGDNSCCCVCVNERSISWGQMEEQFHLLNLSVVLCGGGRKKGCSGGPFPGFPKFSSVFCTSEDNYCSRGLAERLFYSALM